MYRSERKPQFTKGLENEIRGQLTENRQRGKTQDVSRELEWGQQLGQQAKMKNVKKN